VKHGWYPTSHLFKTASHDFKTTSHHLKTASAKNTVSAIALWAGYGQLQRCQPAQNRTRSLDRRPQNNEIRSRDIKPDCSDRDKTICRWELEKRTRTCCRRAMGSCIVARQRRTQGGLNPARLSALAPATSRGGIVRDAGLFGGYWDAPVGHVRVRRERVATCSNTKLPTAAEGRTARCTHPSCDQPATRSPLRHASSQLPQHGAHRVVTPPKPHRARRILHPPAQDKKRRP